MTPIKTPDETRVRIGINNIATKSLIVASLRHIDFLGYIQVVSFVLKMQKTKFLILNYLPFYLSLSAFPRNWTFLFHLYYCCFRAFGDYNRHSWPLVM